MGTRHTSTVLRSAPSPETAWWGRVRFVLGMAQMAAAVVAVVLLFGVGVTPVSLTAVLVASSLTSLCVMLFGSRRERGRDGA